MGHSTIHWCDHCGCEIEIFPEPSKSSHGADFKFSHDNVCRHLPNQFSILSKGDIQGELCLSCLKELKKFIDDFIKPRRKS